MLDRRRGSTWWAPGAAGWWIGVLFAIGATFFALGSTPFLNEVLGSTADSTIFFAGSIFFTSAAFLQYMEAINTGRRSRKGRRRIRIFVLELRDYGWWSSLVQLAGTLYFNVSTFRAMWSETFSTSQVNHLVWKPDIYGSACFLIASILAWLELGHALRVQRPRIISWWIVYLNLFGSVFFAISGISSFVLPTSGNDVDTLLVNLGTFLGALCFFAGAVLLLPERTQERLG